MLAKLAMVCFWIASSVVICVAQQPGINPASFGVVVGAAKPAAVRAANHAAMKACLQAAQTSGQAVILPAATIEIDVPNNGSSASSTFKINRNVQIIGTSAQLSKLKFGPESPTYDYSGFYVGANTYVLFKNCIIEGPTYAGPNGEWNRLTYAILQTGQSGTSYNTPGELRLHNVDIAGEWYTSIQGAHGDALLEFIDCDITGYTQCVQWSASYNYGKKLHAKNTYFHDAGLPGKGHLLYLSPPVSFDIDNCRFGGNYRYAIHHYGSGTLRPQYAMLRNSVVENTCKDGIETTNTGLTQITNTIFNNRGRGVILKGDTVVQDCTFNSITGVTTYDNHANVQVTIARCRFNTPSVAVITSVWPNCVWNISDSDFAGVWSGGSSISSGAAGTQVFVSNCRFTGSWKRGIYAGAGSYYVFGCSFQGSYGEAPVVYDDSAGRIGQMTINNCSFQNSGRSLWAVAGASGKVSGSGNSFAGRQPEGATGMFQLVQLRSQTSPSSIQSASQIAPHFNYSIYNVTGTSQISSIKVGGNDVVNKMCSGRLTLISTGWSLSNSGNIRPRTTARRPIGAVVVLVHNSQTDVWQEQ